MQELRKLNAEKIPTEYLKGRRVVFMKHEKAKESEQCHLCAYYAEKNCPRLYDSEELVCENDHNSVWQYAEEDREAILPLYRTADGKLNVGTPEPTVKPSEQPIGRKYDAGKPMWGLLPPDALEEVVKVLTAGSIKYNEPADQENWRLVDNPQFRYFNAAQRHIYADKRGELIDIDKGESKGTNCYHLACAIASLMFMLQLKIEKDKETTNE